MGIPSSRSESIQDLDDDIKYYKTVIFEWF